MKKKKIVIALGGNAIQSIDASAESQQLSLEKTAKQLVTFIENGIDIVITHGNGPQVGNILLQQKSSDSKKNPAMPLDVCGAMSQGMIGYWMQKSMKNKLNEKDIDKDVVSVVTQVIVDKDDKAFKDPTKPIGPFYSEEEKQRLTKESDIILKEDSGRGYRRVVPSPKPVDIQEYRIINSLLESGNIVITVGGGGIPVIKHENSLKGVEAVIDKDFASQKLAELIDADILLILTAVNNVYIDYNKDTQKKLEKISAVDLKKYIEDGHFAKGSMLPKVEAGIKFASSKNGRKTIITSLENAYEAVCGNEGTIITS